MLVRGRRAGRGVLGRAAQLDRGQLRHRDFSLHAYTRSPNRPSCLGRWTTPSELRDIPAAVARGFRTTPAPARATISGPNRLAPPRFFSPPPALQTTKHVG